MSDEFPVGKLRNLSTIPTVGPTPGVALWRGG